MKHKKPLLYILLLLIQYSITGQNQNWRNSIFEENSNYFEIVKKERASLKHLRTRTDRKSTIYLKRNFEGSYERAY